ncbi:hypothetical protein T440DRAFT_539392 [Plenodomus tracheiphilus IPT5]|uniref:Uncharacterized protein n=1 Tax=Plenodomus tracheiphilus IPT5 TaxID=1408161 RepID=A0A6A7BIF0_9PLEO|nr:hypothetical protein T440DRAFT_539392 [Plenodomus tracheiphilus IPT5]
MTVNNIQPDSPDAAPRNKSASSSVYSEHGLMLEPDKDNNRVFQRSSALERQKEPAARESTEASEQVSDISLCGDAVSAIVLDTGILAAKPEAPESQSTPAPRFEGHEQAQESRRQKAAEAEPGELSALYNMPVPSPPITTYKIGYTEPKISGAQRTTLSRRPSNSPPDRMDILPSSKWPHNHATLERLPGVVNNCAKLITLSRASRNLSVTTCRPDMMTGEDSNEEARISQGQVKSTQASNGAAFRDDAQMRGYLSGKYVTSIEDLEQPVDAPRKRTLLTRLFCKSRRL